MLPTTLRNGTSATHKNAPIRHPRAQATEPSRITHVKSIDYTALDTFRRETIRKDDEARQTWTAKFDPWLVDEYRQMYGSIARNRGGSPDARAISLKRPEWQQPADMLPPLTTRLCGQRRRRVLGAFPETESDKIGWRLLPQHAIDMYGSKTANIAPLPKQYRLSSWPAESFY